MGGRLESRTYRCDTQSRWKVRRGSQPAIDRPMDAIASLSSIGYRDHQVYEPLARSSGITATRMGLACPLHRRIAADAYSDPPWVGPTGAKATANWTVALLL